MEKSTPQQATGEGEPSEPHRSSTRMIAVDEEAALNNLISVAPVKNSI
jgi:hypothetical protein